jgi:Chromatin remodeling factor Mit1 C-terminal Zn finger 2
MQMDHEARNLQDEVPRRSSYSMLERVTLLKELRGSTPTVSSRAPLNTSNDTSTTSQHLTSPLTQTAIRKLAPAAPPPYPPRAQPWLDNVNVFAWTPSGQAPARPVSSIPSNLWATQQVYNLQKGVQTPGFTPIQKTYASLARNPPSDIDKARIPSAPPAKPPKPPSSAPAVKPPMPPQYAKRTPPTAKQPKSSATKPPRPPSSVGNPPQPPSAATQLKPLYVPTRARPAERPSEPIYDDVRPNMGTGISRCQACGNDHLPGQCPLRSKPLTACPGCGYVHLHRPRICPLFWEEEYTSLLLERLKESTEDRKLIENAVDYVRGVKGGIRRRQRGQTNGKKVVDSQ